MLRIILALLIAAPVMASDALPEGEQPEKPEAIQPSKPKTFRPGLNRWTNPDGTFGAVQNDSIGMGAGEPNADGDRR